MAATPSSARSRAADSAPTDEHAKEGEALLREAALELRRLRTQLETVERAAREPIAIVGLACRFPGGANDPESYWRLLREGRDAIAPIPAERWDVARYFDPDPEAPGKMYTRHGGFIDEVAAFDPQFFGISPREALALDPQQRLLLETSYHALEHAQLPAFDLKGSATGVFIGMSFDDYAQFSVRSGEVERIDPHSSLGTQRGVAAGRIAYVFGLQGPVIQIDTTCSSSLVAVHLACQSLRNDECTLALAGGVNLMLTPETTIACCKLKALAPDGRCRTFAADAAGYGRGEGCGMVVLKRLSRAQADGDRILALVAGSAVNHDGQSNGLTAPSGAAQQAVIQRALANAGLAPDDLQYVEAHGTATPLGDPIELLALHAALGQRATPLLVGSVKTSIGHLESAAGIAGLIKVVLALREGQLPPHLHCAERSPRIPWSQLALDLPTRLQPWPATSGPARAGISSFGMSGTNAHVIVEAAPGLMSIAASAAAAAPRPRVVLALSARSEPALRALAAAHAREIAPDALADWCHATNTGRSHFAHRRAFVAADADELRAALAAYTETPREAAPRRASPRALAWLYAGQGSQYLHMGRALYRDEAVFRAAVDECAARFEREFERPLLDALYPVDDEAIDQGAQAALLAQTHYTQAALFAIQYGLSSLWRQWGVAPSAVLGHSLGEYAAACAAGVLRWQDGLELVAARAKLMQALPAGGGMLALAVAATAVEELLPSTLSIAAVNGPASTVVAGDEAALAAFEAACRARGWAGTRLQVSHAFHSPAMRALRADFARLARGIAHAAPQLPIVSSLLGALAGPSTFDADYWVEQMCRPVRRLLDTTSDLETSLEFYF